MLKFKLSIFLLSFFSLTALPVFADDDIGEIIDEINKRKVEEISGTVGEVDSIGNIIVINGLTSGGNNEEMRLNVPDGAKITQGEETISLGDIDVGDSVTVRYTIDRDNNEPKVINIVDNNIGNNQM
ncbi:MAG: hypothetical protein PHG68_04340 [Candidatus Omnitrophica bacterium]|nr:hypothetical protein [Candidatus Omnitrophota bacterium]